MKAWCSRATVHMNEAEVEMDLENIQKKVTLVTKEGEGPVESEIM